MVSSYNYVDKDARFVNVDACFGSLKETLCFGVEISIVFSDLWRTHLLAASSILLTLAPMQRRCHFIMAEIVFFLCKHSISANDVCDIFHLHATLPTSVRIHSVVDVIGLGQLSVGFLIRISIRLLSTYPTISFIVMILVSFLICPSSYWCYCLYKVCVHISRN